MERSIDDDDHPGFRFGRFGAGREIPSRPVSGRSERGGSAPVRSGREPISPVGIPRPTSREQVLNRPLPPKVPDAEFTPDPMSSFLVGDRIEHNRFGIGKVLFITGQVPDIKATIAFEKYGEKILLLKYAKIRHI